MSGRTDWIDLIRRLAPKYGVDPQAALAVASTEGLSGGVGDGGHAFGPFQLNDAGGVITGRAGDHRAFAESPAGIEWALQQIGGVSKGLTGKAAIENIVRRFERPADPTGQISRAFAAMGDFDGGSPISASRAASGPPVQPGTPSRAGWDPLRMQYAMNLLQKRGGLGKLAPETLMAALKTRYGPQQATPAPSRVQATQQGSPPAEESSRMTPAKGALAEAFYDPLGQWDNGRFSKQGIGGHSDHVHASITDPEAMLAAIRQAQQAGLAARENPYVDPVDPVHVQGSYHYKDFPGKFDGRSLGEGLDVSGDPAKMSAYFKWLLANLR